ncbi:hypothetical protein C0580_01235 [Candidatus Parcubacteria bacterium]|nr:MAG: hypothetical protein C0580_01235 [Candidatus Parcubacteria bacterium]
MKKIIIFSLLFLPKIASAQASGSDIWGTNALQNLNTGTKNINDTIAGVINVALGFLGTLAVAGIIFGGFKKMTAYGDAEKNKTGNNAMVAGAVGLAIVLAAYALSQFILLSLYNETV